MNRFFIYEEYGAKYELMIKDVAAAHRTMPGWSSYQKGLEVLASSLSSADSRDDQTRRALTIGDLLVKVRFLRPDLRAKLTQTADPTCMQISAPLLRVAEAHPGDRLPLFADGNRKHAHQTP
jgi:hypothetical protein